jgi:hypothetical protein
MNWEQVKGIVERVATLVIAYLVGRGVVPDGVSADVVAVIVLVASIAWGWWVNTPRALADAARSTQ